MKSLLVANQKGGVGKSTIVVHLAHCLARRGLKVMVIDTDHQANSSNALRAFAASAPASSFFLGGKAHPIPPAREGITLISGDPLLLNVDSGKVDSATATATFRKRYADLCGKGYDVCLIDSSPNFGVRFLAISASADYLLAPIELTSFSLQGVVMLLTILQNLTRGKNKTTFLGMLPNKVDGRNPRHMKILAQLQAKYGPLLCPVSLHNRSTLEDALVSGRPIWQNQKTSARAARLELDELTSYLLEKMEVLTHG